MARAIRDLGVTPDYLVLDAFRLPLMPIQQRPIIKGDAICMSIAAASVVAKVTRDRIMRGLDEEYAGYHFARHKGYGTGLHAEAILHKDHPDPSQVVRSDKGRAWFGGRGTNGGRRGNS